MALNPKQLAFVAAYIANGQNATQAAITAGYSPRSAASQGHELLKHPEVSAKLKGVAERAALQVELDAASVLEEIGHIAHSDLLDAFINKPGDPEHGTLRALESMPVGLRRAIASIKFEELFHGASGEKFVAGRVVEIKLWNKPQALEMEGKHLKLFTDKVEHTGKVTLEQLVTEAAARNKAGK